LEQRPHRRNCLWTRLERKYVRRKRIFYTVVGIWLALSVMWLSIDLMDDSSSFWFYRPMLGTASA
jgi:hypothetical protein